MLSIHIYLQHLQVNKNVPKLSHEDALLKAQSLVFSPSSPIPISQINIEEVLTIIAFSPSPNIQGLAQPTEMTPSLPKFYCFYCEQVGHASFECPVICQSSTSHNHIICHIAYHAIYQVT